MPWNVGSTPKTVGVSANGFGISFDGVKRLRAVDAPTPSTVDWITRRSARLSPADTWRRRWNACWSGAGRDSTIRLRTPIDSITAITCCCAPAPIDSIATTAATPKIMPSMVSSERSLCANRLSMPIVSVGSTSRVITGGLRERRPAWPDLLAAGLVDAAPRRVGSASATSVPSATPSTTADVSVLPMTLTGVGVKPPTPPPRVNTTVPPSRSNTAPRGTCSTPTCGAPRW